VARRKQVPKSGPGVAIMASILRHHDDSGRQHSTADAAREMGVPYVTLDRWIRMGAVPDFDKAFRLADYMGITLDELATLYFDRKSDIAAPQQATRATPAATVADVQRLARLTAKRRGVGAKPPKRQGEGGRS
jgi:hypothetical protein